MNPKEIQTIKKMALQQIEATIGQGHPDPFAVIEELKTLSEIYYKVSQLYETKKMNNETDP